MNSSLKLVALLGIIVLSISNCHLFNYHKNIDEFDIMLNNICKYIKSGNCDIMYKYEFPEFQKHISREEYNAHCMPRISKTKATNCSIEVKSNNEKQAQLLVKIERKDNGIEYEEGTAINIDNKWYFPIVSSSESCNFINE